MPTQEEKSGDIDGGVSLPVQFEFCDPTPGSTQVFKPAEGNNPTK